MKLLLLLVLACVACRLLAGRWPWQLLGSATRASDIAQARAVLGVGRGASRDEIVEAHRRRIAQVHPDRGGSSELVHEANAARDRLLGTLLANDRPH